MLMSTSSNFLALCQEQIVLLTQRLGASFSILYLTPELVESSINDVQLIPVLAYPESLSLKQMQFSSILALPNRHHRVLTSGSPYVESLHDYEYLKQEPSNLEEDYLLNHHQIVLPLIYEGLMMGLLVTARADRDWNEEEQDDIQRIAKSLAIACLLDQRRAWLEQQMEQQQLLQVEQRDLLDNLLHQLRNPLTAIRTFGKLLLKRFRPTDPNRQVATSIIRESDRLQELLQQLEKVIDLSDTADLSPVTRSKNPVFVQAIAQKETKPLLLLPGDEQTSSCLLTDILEPLLLSFQNIASERNQQLITNMPANLPLVKVNAKALREVLINIIDNALKYTPTGGKIIIQLGQEKANFQGIAISDTGPGIPVQDLEHLGERRYRGIQAQTAIPGTGLGIAIAKQLIKQMQGEMEVFSPAINSSITSPHAPGTTFIIWLPEVREAGN